MQCRCVFTYCRRATRTTWSRSTPIMSRSIGSIERSGESTSGTFCRSGLQRHRPVSWLGWRNLERKRLIERGRPDLVLALALVHHVVIGGNIPMAEFLHWLSELGGELVIEFVTREDPMVATLLRNKEDHYADYHQDVFERELAARFVDRAAAAARHRGTHDVSRAPDQHDGFVGAER